LTEGATILFFNHPLMLELSGRTVGFCAEATGFHLCFRRLRPRMAFPYAKARLAFDADADGPVARSVELRFSGRQ
jgi:hypothetical protein